MKPGINSHIYKITPYRPGKPIEEVKREFKLKQVVKLASNENPLGPSRKVIAAIENAACGINRYPDGDCFYLKRKLSEKLNVVAKNIIFGNGSDEILDLAVKTFLRPGRDEIIISNTTFLEYKITGQIFGVRIREIPLCGLKYDLAAISKAVNKKTKIIFIANPNNPTGTYVDKGEFNEFLRSIGDNVLIVYDEAYSEFVDEDDFPFGREYFKEKNFMFLKTFSKIYGLAGLRLGYGVAEAGVIDAMNRVRQPFNANSLAQAAAIAALDDEEYLKRSRQAVWQGKKFLYEQFDAMGIEYVKSVANFILVNVRRDIFRPLLKKGVIVRPMDMYGLKGYIRVTIGTSKENETFIKALKSLMR